MLRHDGPDVASPAPPAEDGRPWPVVLGGPVDVSPPWALGFLAARAVPAVERVTANTWERVVRLGGRPVRLRIRFAEGGIPPTPGARRPWPGRIEAGAEPAVPVAVLREAAARLLDVERDLTPFRALARRDPVLRRAGAAPAVRGLQILDPFEVLARAVLGQQVSLSAARTLAGRLVRRFGQRATASDRRRRRGDGGLPADPWWCFPAASDVAGAALHRLTQLGLTRRRALALRGVARAVEDGEVDPARLRRLPAEEAGRALASLDGVGPWTAAYALMRGFGHADAFPATDLGVQTALRRLEALPNGMRRRDIEAAAEAWRPWRSYATLHLWSGLNAG